MSIEIINNTFKVTITSDEYEKCCLASCNRWSNKKKGEWGRGMINSVADPHRVERIGLIGECAFGQAFNLPVNFSYMQGGDEQDFMLKNLSVNVKVSARNYGKGLVKRIDASGRKIPLKHDVYVFGYIENKNVVYLMGFALKKDIINRPLVPSLLKDKKHLNQEVYYSELKSIVKLHELYQVHSL